MAGRTGEEARPKRELILTAARNLFVNKGYEDTTIADIAQEAGVAVGTVYLYFRNKHEVYTGVSLDVEAMITSAFEAPTIQNLPFEQIPAAMIDASFRVCHEHMSLVSLLQVDMQSQEERLQHKQSSERVTEAIDTLLRVGIAQGALAPFDTKMYAQMINLSVSAIFHQCFAVEKGEHESLYRQYLTEMIERLLFGPSLKQGTNS